MRPSQLGLLLCVLAVLVAAPKPSLSQTLEPSRAFIVGQSAAGAAFRTGPTEARKADKPKLAVVVEAVERIGKRTRTVFVADASVAPLFVRGRRVRESRIRSWDSLAGAEVRWFQIEPHAFREPSRPARNGATTRFHSNVSMEPGSFGKWLGYDEITYFETALPGLSSDSAKRLIAAAVVPSDPRIRRHGGLGTMRFRVEVRAGERVLSTAGKDAVDRAGILPTVHRVSLRADDSFVGYLTSYFLVPEVFGSAGTGRNHQTDRFTGADCADVLTGAARRSGRRLAYTSVKGLPRDARRFVGPFAVDDQGRSAQPIRGVRRGDIIRIDYGGSLTGHTPRSWDHVAVLYVDRAAPTGLGAFIPNGVLDPFDLIVHMGHPRLVVEPLSGQSPATLDVLRWKR